MSNATHSLPEVGFVRVRAVLAVIPISKSAWHAGVREGRYPRPVRIVPRSSAWRVEDIRALIERLGSQAGGGQVK